LTINSDINGANFDSVDQALHLSVRCIKTRTPIVFNGLTAR
jgi:hypothetical protein